MTSSHCRAAALRARLLSCFLVAVALFTALASQARAQVTGNIASAFGTRVGGVSIDAAGMVTPADKSTRIPVRDALRKMHAAPAAALNGATEMRMVSLKKLDEAIVASGKTTAEQLPDDIRFLAGIQRIQFVLVYPEENDIVIAGPGEGWKIDDEGNIVGVTTGRPVLRLEDLVVAFRTVDNARQGGISCSIDPTPEGRHRLETLSANHRGSGAPSMVAMRKALGPQQITLTGVPTDSHLARILVSSDYHMKRLGMNLDNSPVKGLPSFIDMLKRDSSGDYPTPRWWLECDYEPLGRSEDGLGFEIRGRGVKCMAEDEIIDAQGNATGKGTASGPAQRWADLMTAHYDELSTKDASFGELRNVMDMCVVAALIAKEQLLLRANCQLPTLWGTQSALRVQSMNSPKEVESLCSSVKRGDSVIVMSGGVQIGSWQVADKMETRPAVAQVRAKAKTTGANSIWWNAGQ
jgi:hypothetical protein